MDWLCATVTWVPTRPACEPAVSHVGRLFRTWAGLPRLGIAGPRADEKGVPRHARCEPSNTTCPISRRMDTSCCWGGDLSAVLRGKVAVVGGRVCRVPGFAQIADHLTQNSPFLPFFGEVVCTLGGMLLMSAARAGDASIRCFSCHHDPQITQTPGTTGREIAAPVPNGGQVQS